MSLFQVIITPDLQFKRGSCSSVVCADICGLFFIFIWPFLVSVLRFTASDYPCGIFTASDYSCGIFTASDYSCGIFTASDYSYGIFTASDYSCGIFTASDYSCGIFTAFDYSRVIFIASDYSCGIFKPFLSGYIFLSMLFSFLRCVFQNISVD
jgi:hypothetical protein